MTEHPNTQDYINRAERNAAYWREEADRHISLEAKCLSRFEAESWELEVEQLRRDLTA